MKIYFGGSGGISHVVSSTGSDRRIGFWTDDFRVNAIVIGDQRYGKELGRLSAWGTLPADCVFHLLGLQMKSSGGSSALLSWFKANINGQVFSAGEFDSKMPTLDVGLNVRIEEIRCGEFIDGIKFEIVSRPEDKIRPSNQLLFGSIEATYAELRNTADKNLIFRSINRRAIVAIQIGNDAYGGKDGTANLPAKLPVDGTFYLKNLQSRQYGALVPLTSFSADVGDEYVKVESDSDLRAATVLDISSDSGGMPVRLSGVYFTESTDSNNDAGFVHALQFELVNT